MKMLIDGEWCDAVSGEMIEIINPADLSKVDKVPSSGPEDISIAVDAAEEAFPKWSAVPIRERGKVLKRAAENITAEVDRLTRILVQEQGKPFAEAKGEVMGFVNVLDYYASICGSLHGKTLELEGIGKGLTFREPIGVCGAIIPWNMPILIMAWKTAPALITGNTVVLKPSSETPLCNLNIASLFQKAGLPPGALNVVTGTGIKAGEPLASHSKVRKISFTGASSTGKRVASLAAPALKHITLELGGSDPSIVCSDADLERTAEGIVKARFYNCGQACTSLKRLYVMEDVADRLTELLLSKISSLKVGNGMEKDVDLGPLINRTQRSKMLDLIKESSTEANVLCGGDLPQREGYFFNPALVVDVPATSRLMREEVFGPILPMARVESVEEALELATKTNYGLGASVWTNDLGTARTCAHAFKSGMVWVNMHLRVPAEAPFGGVKESGLGRENGTESIEAYTEWKTVILG